MSTARNHIKRPAGRSYEDATLLLTRHNELLAEICSCCAVGAAPWWNDVAAQGPCLLGRSGMSLRGLSAIIAWHAGSFWPAQPLAWRLLPIGQLPENAAIFELPANGGTDLYAAIPETRANRLVDGPGVELLEQSTTKILLNRLNSGLLQFGDISLNLAQDETPIISLAQALLRPLGHIGRPERVRERLSLTPVRLKRIASWAQWLADHVRYSAASPPRRLLAPSVGRRRTIYWTPEAVDSKLDQLRQSNILCSNLPAELRAKSGPDEEHRVPERELRKELFDSKSLVRSPLIGGLRRHIETTPAPQLAQILEDMEWSKYAALGFALRETLNISRQPIEPGDAWRLVGQRLRNAVADFKFAEVTIPTAAARAWARLFLHHARTSWLDPRSPLTLRDLPSTRRWDFAKLDAWTREWSQGGLHAGGGDISVTIVPPVVLARMRQPRQQPLTTEADTLTAIADALACAKSWPSILDAARSSRWERHTRTKRSGGVRVLDVPAAELRRAQRVIADVVLALMPPRGSATAYHPGASPALHARAHAGAAVGVRMDIADFFGSVRPSNVSPWLGGNQSILRGWSEQGSAALVELVFYRRDRRPYLPQGAPSSPSVANLAAIWLDEAIATASVEAFGQGQFSYSRYADDLVLSSRQLPAPFFAAKALEILTESIKAQGWTPNEKKTQLWNSRGDGEEALHLCGLRVPGHAAARTTLDKDTFRRARAALHQLRHRVGFDKANVDTPHKAHGLMAYAYAATGDLHWLAYTSRHVLHLARKLAGPFFCESFLAGWSDPP